MKTTFNNNKISVVQYLSLKFYKENRSVMVVNKLYFLLDFINILKGNLPDDRFLSKAH